MGVIGWDTKMAAQLFKGPNFPSIAKNETNFQLPGTSGRKSHIHSTTGGGVILPFD